MKPQTIRAYALKNAIAHDGKATQGPVVSSLFNEGLKREDMKTQGKIISEIIQEVNSLSPEQQKKEFEKLKETVSERESREGLPELPNVKKSGVVMRFRPSPSGPLHLGHIISNLPSSMYVEKYGGKFYVIVDDTDPETTLKEAYSNIKKACDWIFGNVTKYINSSDRMDLYYKYAKKLIEKNAAYVCICPPDEFRDLAKRKEECICRNFEIKDQLHRWKLMLNKDKKSRYEQGEAVLRFKTPEEVGGMRHPNPAMRDFPLARINETSHPLQKNKYRVWPLMNLVVSVDDMELKMTHIIRGKDHKDNAKRQEMIFKIFGKEYPKSYFIGRLKFTDLVLSKRQITEKIKSGEFTGEEDEKIPTILSLKKRGYTKKAFEKFIEQRGLPEVDKVISEKDFFQSLKTFQKK